MDVTGFSSKKQFIKNTVKILGAVALVTSLLINLFTFVMPIVKYYGTSMSPVLEDGQILVVSKLSDVKAGDIVAFYYGNKLLVKRYIAGPGSWVDIQENGTMVVDNMVMDEPYVDEKIQAADHRCGMRRGAEGREARHTQRHRRRRLSLRPAGQSLVQ